MDEKTRRLALLMEEDELPPVIPPREMTEEEMKVAVEMYLQSPEGKKRIEQEIYRVAQQHVADRYGATPVNRNLAAQYGVTEDPRYEEERRMTEDALADVAERAAARMAQEPAAEPARARDNSDYYAEMRERVRRRTNRVSSTRQTGGPIEGWEDGDPIGAMDTFLAD